MVTLDRQKLPGIRRSAVTESFGGPNTYELLRRLNPQIDLILNAGIVAGADYAAERAAEDTQETYELCQR